MSGTKNRSGGNRTIGRDGTAKDAGPLKPSELRTEVSAKWDQLMLQLPQHALRGIDVHELKLLAECLVLADNLADAMLANPTDHSTARLFLNVTDRVHRLSAAFGLNPADRRRLDLQADEERLFQEFDICAG